MNTQKFSLNHIDYKKIGMHFLLVSMAAGITYLLNDVVPTLFTGEYAVFATVITSTILKGAQRFLSSYN